MSHAEEGAEAMNDTLFPLPESPSPRLLWIARHGVQVIDNGGDVLVESESRAWREYRWCAYCGEPGRTLFAGNEAGFGDTEADAIVDLCRKTGLKTWQEEAL